MQSTCGSALSRQFIEEAKHYLLPDSPVDLARGADAADGIPLVVYLIAGSDATPCEIPLTAYYTPVNVGAVLHSPGVEARLAERIMGEAQSWHRRSIHESRDAQIAA
jgi:hypothetical protein